MPFAEVNGYRMRYTVVGDDDAPAMAFIHGGLGGGDGARDTINRQADGFSADYRCVFYDRRCCGQSEAPADGYDIPNCARDLRALLAHLGIDKAHILGSSAGGPIALQFALDYPEMTDALLLVNTMTYSQEAQREIRRQELRKLRERVAAEGRSAAVAAALADRFPQMAAEDPERFARLAAENEARADGIAATHQAYLDIGDSLENRLAELKMPVAIVHGDQDSRIPIECGRSLNAAISQSAMYVIAGAEHGLTTNEAAGRTQEILLGFLRGVRLRREAEHAMSQEDRAQVS
jgi:3-oxoadipate enol-lactonase